VGGEKREVRSQKQEARSQRSEVRSGRPELPRLVFDADQPDRVMVNDRAVTLTPYPYELLCLLAQNTGRVVSYREIDEALWPDAKVEPQQISAHKRAVVRALAGVIGLNKAQAIVETVARRGLRFNLPATNIRFRR